MPTAGATGRKMNQTFGSSGPSRRNLLRALAAGSLAAIPALSACGRSGPSTVATPHTTANRYGTAPADYARVGLSPDGYQPWEDGFRTNGTNNDPRVYEWWHSECTSEDGTVVSLTLKTRTGDGLTPEPTEQERLPAVNLSITTAWGTEFSVIKSYSWSEFSSATDRCDVRVGPFTLSGGFKTYRLRGSADDITLDLTLTSLVPPFRPGTGYIFLGDTNSYHAWFAAVPAGKTEGTVTFGGEKRRFKGPGYHDHIWGNVAFPQFVDRWRSGRGTADKYAVLGRDIHLRSQWDSSILKVLLVDDTETGKRLVAAYTDDMLNATEIQVGTDPDILSEVQWSYIGAESATLTMTATDKPVTGRPYVSTNTAQQANLGSQGTKPPWYTRYEADIALRLGNAGPGYRLIGKGTLDNAQFGLIGPPAPKPEPS
jgi:hypothetical protein